MTDDVSGGDFAPRPWVPRAEYYIAAGPRGDVDIRDAIEAFGLDYNRGAVMKYVARAGRKPGNGALLDLLKAREHINREIACMSGEARAPAADASSPHPNPPPPAGEGWARYWYLASPYRGHPHGFEAAAAEAARWAAWLVDVGIEIYSPIVHSHPIAQFVKTAPPEGDPGSGSGAGFWLERQVPFMAAAAGLLVAHIEGWSCSTGIAWERDWFRAAGRPIHDVPRDWVGGDGAVLRAMLRMAAPAKTLVLGGREFQLRAATEAELAAQRESWVRGEMAIGLDAAEAADREARGGEAVATFEVRR